MAHSNRAYVAAFSLALACSAALGQQAPTPPSPAAAADVVAKDAPALREFRNVGFGHAFLAFEKKVQVGPEFVTIGDKDTTDRGGALVDGELDLSALADATPYIVVRPGAANKAPTLNLIMADKNGSSARFTFPLAGLPTDRFTVVYADGGATLARPMTVSNAKQPENPTFDPGKINQWQIQGNWQGRTFEVSLTGVYLAKDVPQQVLDARVKAEVQRKQQAEQARRAAEAKKKRLNDLLTNCPHPADGARVINVALVAPDQLGVEIQSREFQYGALEPYSQQPDDRLTGGSKQWVVRDGKLAEETVGQVIERKGADGKFTKLGTISFDQKYVLRPDRVTGTELDPLAMEMTEAYAISSGDDPAYANPVAPAKVSRKAKPNTPSGADGGMAIRHNVYLQLPQPLKEGATYQVHLKALNTRDATVNYVHKPREVRSEAIHASHVGYDPNAPFKRAYLSIWLGTGGGYQLADAPAFELIDAKTGQTAFSGKATLAKAKDAPEQLKDEKDYAKTAVYWLDFSDFSTPGSYKVFVPGIGTSYPFAIAENVWQEPFKLSLQGLLSQRSGIGLGPPFLNFKRPRAYHPDDGVKFYQIDIGIHDGQEGARGTRLVELWNEKGKLEEVKGIWGGYQDAGDWDAYTTSLITANYLTEAFEVSGEFAEQVKLSLPGEEPKNAIPDLLDEALWGMSYFKRLQLPDGGVREGYGDGWGARNGDLSWNNSNPVCVYAARPGTSYTYAGAAAKMARVIAKYDQALSNEFKESALKAWEWADGQGGTKEARDLKGYAETAPRAMAAVELYWLTKDASFHEAFKQITELNEPLASTQYSGGWIEPMKQNNATFTYARLPDDLADAKLKANAVARFELTGNIATHFMKNNAFNIVTAYPGVPCSDFLGYFTAPGGIINVDVVRAHKVTGKREYLKAVVASTNSTLGANPDNMAMTTGLGPNPVLYPLRLDSRRTGQKAPVGLTVYGAADQSTGGTDWVHTWLIGPVTVPNARTWPAQESYYDVFGWPGCNEYTVDRPVALSAYTWCYLSSIAK